MTNTDGIKWRPVVDVVKYNPETVATIALSLGHEPTGAELRYLEAHEGLVPDEITHCEGNALVTVGRTLICQAVVGTATNTFSATRGVIGVGNSNTAWAANQVALQGTAYYRLLDSAASTASAGSISAAATFASAEANHAWEEWCFAVATAAVTNGTTFATVTTSGTMLNRKVESLGTKVLGAVWTLQATVTIT